MNPYDKTSTAFGSPGLATAGVIPGVDVKLGAFDASNRSSSEVYLLLFEQSTVPTAGQVPKIAYPVPAGVSGASGRIARDRSTFGVAGCRFPLGLAWAVSLSPTSYVAPADPSLYPVVIVLV